MRKKEKSINELKKVVQSYLDDYVNTPALEMVEKEIILQDKLANQLLINLVFKDLVEKKGIAFDKNELSNLPKNRIKNFIEELEKFIKQGFVSDSLKSYWQLSRINKYLLYYLDKEINWVAVSILSASYISAFIIMRSILELLIAIATKKTGRMNERINNIAFLLPEEKKKTKKLWGELCGWTHPYSKWLKEICPIFISHKPIYHPKLLEKCLEKLELIADLFMVIVIEKFEISMTDVLAAIKQHNLDINNYNLLNGRLGET